MEFQAVVFAAGRASRMTELTFARPKCLLPIGNKPMIWYSLNMLENAGFQEVIVVVQDQWKDDVAAVADAFQLNIKVDLFPIPKNEDFGTADSLRLIKEKIKTDVLLISCDLVTDFSLHKILNLHRIHQASLTALFCNISPDVAMAPVPGPKAKYKQERDLVGIDLQTSRMVFLASEADFDEDLTLPKSMFKLFPQMCMHSRLIDAHLYVVKKWVCDYIAENRTWSMLKGEVLPDLVRKQFSRPTRKNPDKDIPNPDTSVLSLNMKKDIYSFQIENKDEIKVRETSLWNDHCGDLQGAYHDHNIRCYAYVTKEGLCLRANTLSSYCELNRQVIKQWQTLFPGEETAQLTSKGQIGADCIVGKSSHISDKCSIKHSVLGQHCHIEDKVKITNCVIMDYVTIREGTTLQGSVVLDNATVESRCDIKDCLIGSGHTVHSGSKSANEILIDADRLMEI